MRDWDWGEIVLKTVFVLAVVVTVAFLALVVITTVDQASTRGVTYADVLVVDKQQGFMTIIMSVGNIPVTYLTPYWRISFQVEDKILTGEVYSSCFNRMSVGDRMDIQVRHGRHSLGVYPICP